MSHILYIADQGATLTKRGQRLVIQKAGQIIHWLHAFQVDQVVVMGNVSITPGAIAFLLQQGIDTVFMSFYGKYRGRLVSQFGKNIELRRVQFDRFGDMEFRLALSRRYVQGKIANCRVLLRRANRELISDDITNALNRMRMMARMSETANAVDMLMGMEGQAAAAYFGVFGKLIRTDDMVFDGRNRRPPKDPVNVLLSLGYTLLANAIETQVNVAGLDPYLGCLHGVDYGRPSLVLDLMEEFRPVIVDSLVLMVINKRIIRPTDFYRPSEREPAAFGFAEEEESHKDYPILFTHEGMKKFIGQLEGRFQQKVLYTPTGKQLSYRDVFLEQVRMLVRHLKGESPYESFTVR